MSESLPSRRSGDAMDDAIHVLTPGGFDTLCGQEALTGMNVVDFYDAQESGVDQGDGCWTCIEKLEKSR